MRAAPTTPTITGASPSSLAACLALPRLVKGPILLHTHDWHTAPGPGVPPHYLAHERYARTQPAWCRCTIPGTRALRARGHARDRAPLGLYNWQQLEWYGKVNFLKGGLTFADMVTTVSPTQAKELRTGGGGFGLHDLFIASATADRVLNGSTSGCGKPVPRYPDHRAVFSRQARGQAQVQGRAPALLRLPQPPGPLFGMTGRL